MNQNFTPLQSPPRKGPVQNHANFIEALKSVGGSTAKSFTHDVMGGVAKDFVQSFTGGSPGSNQENLQNREAITPEEQIRQEILRAQRHKEVNETAIDKPGW